MTPFLPPAKHRGKRKTGQAGMCWVCNRKCTRRDPSSRRYVHLSCRRKRQRDQVTVRIRPGTAAAILRAAKKLDLSDKRLGPALNAMADDGLFDL